MNEQQQEMRKEFETWFERNKMLIIGDEIMELAISYHARQAAYRPKPDVEVVTRSICKADMVVPDELSLGSGKPRWMQYTRQAQAAINAIFKEGI